MNNNNFPKNGIIRINKEKDKIITIKPPTPIKIDFNKSFNIKLLFDTINNPFQKPIKIKSRIFFQSHSYNHHIL